MLFHLLAVSISSHSCARIPGNHVSISSGKQCPLFFLVGLCEGHWSYNLCQVGSSIPGYYIQKLLIQFTIQEKAPTELSMAFPESMTEGLGQSSLCCSLFFPQVSTEQCYSPLNIFNDNSNERTNGFHSLVIKEA